MIVPNPLIKSILPCHICTRPAVVQVPTLRCGVEMKSFNIYKKAPSIYRHCVAKMARYISSVHPSTYLFFVIYHSPCLNFISSILPIRIRTLFLNAEPPKALKRALFLSPLSKSASYGHQTFEKRLNSFPPVYITFRPTSPFHFVPTS